MLQKRFYSLIRKKAVKYTLLVIFGLFVGIVMLEVCLRAIYFFGEKERFGLKPLRTTITWQEDPDIGKVLLTPNTQGYFVTDSKEYSNFVSANSEGFYDVDHQNKKESNVYRILFLGDSFAQSLHFPLEQTYFKQIERELGKEFSERQIEVITLGMGDTGTAQQFLALKKFGMKYKPDLVVHMFLTANDLKNNSRTLQGDPYRPYFKLGATGKLELLPHQKREERDFSRIKEAIKNLRLVEMVLKVRQRVQVNSQNKQFDYPIDYHVYDQSYNKEYQESWDVTKNLIKETRDLVESNGGRYLLAVLSNNEQVNKEVWEKLQILYPNLKTANLDLEKPDILLTEFCINESVNCLFMLPTFTQYVEANPNHITHYKYDGHWNEIGNKLAAELLFEQIINYLKKSN